jgi:hypothetical protein
MGGLVLCMAVAMGGVQVGWEPTDDGGVEYIIQFPPEALEALRVAGEFSSDISNEIPPSVRGQLRTYRIVLGNQKLKRELPKNLIAAPAALPNRGPYTPGTTKAGNLIPPRTLPEGPGAKPTPGKAAAHEESSKTEAKPDGESKPSGGEPSAAEPKPWWTLALVMVGLFASLGGNVYLVWIARGLRARCRTLLGRAAPVTG